jgi:hypothetical protein
MTAWKYLGVMLTVASSAYTGSLATLPLSHGQQEADASAPKTQNIYEDDRIRVSIPPGWTLSQPTAPYRNAEGGLKTVPVQGAGAMLTNGKYKLYLLSHNGQVSGIMGGRYGEINEILSPWLDPRSLCPAYIHQEVTKLTDKLARVDNYYDTAHPAAQPAGGERPKNCGEPSQPGVFWYGSYFAPCRAAANTPEGVYCGGYFLYFPELAGTGSDRDPAAEMTFSLTYETADLGKGIPNSTTDSGEGLPPANQLPRKGDEKLVKMLDDATAIVTNIRYK